MADTEKNYLATIARLRIAIAAVDVVLFSVRDKRLQVFLIPINRPPYYTNVYGLPGGIIQADESAEAAAQRHLAAKTGLKESYLEQLHTFSDPQRDKRSRAISVAFLSLVPAEKAQHTSAIGHWYPVKKLPALAYDHAAMITLACQRLKDRLAYSTIASTLLPEQFTLPELQDLYEIILERPLDKRNFRRKVVATNIVKPVGQAKPTTHRPAQLFTFSQKGVVSTEVL